MKVSSGVMGRVVKKLEANNCAFWPVTSARTEAFRKVYQWFSHYSCTQISITRAIITTACYLNISDLMTCTILEKLLDLLLGHNTKLFISYLWLLSSQTKGCHTLMIKHSFRTFQLTFLYFPVVTPQIQHSTFSFHFYHSFSLLVCYTFLSLFLK